jgi:hypothetical protein
MNDVDVTGRECANLARHFTLARDDEYTHALTPAGRRYYEAAHNAALAARLYATSCGRLGYAEACGAARLMAAQATQTTSRAPVQGTQSDIPRPPAFHTWTATEREDYEVGDLPATLSAEALCGIGGRSAAFHTASAACMAAHNAALAERDFEGAMQYAFVGCVRHSDFAGCRRAANVPLTMGLNNLQVPRSMHQRMKEMAESVCSSSKLVVNVTGRDVTARECTHLARQFVLARDEEYQSTFTPHAAAFFEAIYDRGRAIRLSATACNRLADKGACAQQHALGVRLDPRDIIEAVSLIDRDLKLPGTHVSLDEHARIMEILERESATALAIAGGSHVVLSLLDEATEALERESGDRHRALLAGRTCTSANAAAPEGTNGCWAAYRHAFDTAQFELALRYAATGCERHADAGSCRLVADLPLRMIESNVPPEIIFATEIKRLANVVCTSGKGVTNLSGADVTGRICHHFADHLVSAGAEAAKPRTAAARRYVEWVHDPVRAGTLYRAACDRHAYAASCGAQLSTTPGRLRTASRAEK